MIPLSRASATSIRAVLLNAEGQVLEQSTTNIGFRTAYVKPKAAAGSPIRGALVTTDVSPGREGGTFTDAKGKYLLSYVNMPCPGFDIEYTHYFIPRLYYSIFNPRSPRGIGLYYELHQVYDWCFGSFANLKNSITLSGQATYLNIIGILAAQATPAKRLDIRIDVLALTGKGRLINGEGEPVPLGDATAYTTDLPLFTPGNPQALDLDGDRNPDTVINLANETPIDPNTRLPQTIPPGTVAVYFGGNTPQRDPASNALLATWDLTRRQDTQWVTWWSVKRYANRWASPHPGLPEKLGEPDNNPDSDTMYQDRRHVAGMQKPSNGFINWASMAGLSA